MRLHILSAIVSVFVMITSAAAADADRTCTAGNAPSPLECIENRTDIGKTPEVSFSVKCVDEGIVFSVDLTGKVKIGGKTPDEVLELFFKTDEKLSKRRYYQFFGNVSQTPLKLKEQYIPIVSSLGAPTRGNMEILPFYYDSISENFPYLKNYAVTVNSDDSASHVTLMIPWSDIQTILPFDDEGKGKSWRLNVRYSNGPMTWNWQGQLHQPDTWGILRFPDIPKDKLSRIYRTAGMQNLSFPINIEKWLFDEETVSPVRIAPEVKALPEEMSGDLAAAKEFAESTQAMTQLRSLLTSNAELSAKDSRWKQYSSSSENGVISRQELVFGDNLYAIYDDKGKVRVSEARAGYVPKAASATVPAKMLEMQYCFGADSAPESSVWIMNFSRRYVGGPKVFTEIKLNDRIIADFKPSEYFKPSNIMLGEVKKGDVLSIVCRSSDGSAASRFSDFFTVEEFKFGMTPPKHAVDFANGNIFDRPRQHIDENGRIYAPELSRHVPQCIDLLLREPRVVFLGDAMMDGFGFTDSMEELSKTYSCAEIGTVGSKTFNVLWRVKYGVFDTVKPDLVVLNLHPSFSDVKTAVDAFKAVVGEIRAQSPGTKILILSIYPPKKTGKYSPELPFVLQNKAVAGALADGQNVFFADVTAKFFNDDGTLKKELYKDHVYFTEAGYRIWAEAAMPYMKRFASGKNTSR